MTLTFHRYKDSDLELLQSSIAAWRKQDLDGIYCHTGDIPHRLYNGNRGVMPLSDITRIYYQGTSVVALLLCYPRHEELDIFIHPDFRENTNLFVDIVRAGYEIVYDYMLKNDKGDNPIMVSCSQSDISLQSILRMAGFEQDNHYLNLTRRKLDNLPEAALPDGFTIRSATMEDAEQLANVHNKSFTSKWTADIYRNEVMQKPGYTPEREFVVVAPDGTFAGFTVTWLDTVNKVGLFEPLGTHEDFRRMGLARALMTYAMRQMKNDGMIEAEVCYETENPASEHLYKGLGFSVQHHIYEWKYYPKGNQL